MGWDQSDIRTLLTLQLSSFPSQGINIRSRELRKQHVPFITYPRPPSPTAQFPALARIAQPAHQSPPPLRRREDASKTVDQQRSDVIVHLQQVRVEIPMQNGTMDETACEDLKAFERRLTEIVHSMQPSAGRWRILLVLASVSTAIGAYQWLSDPITLEVSFTESLGNNFFFTASLLVLLILFFGFGIHKRVVAPSIIASRCRSVLADFNLSCDDKGKLILKPRPTTP